jgi:hypothetical protein
VQETRDWKAAIEATVPLRKLVGRTAKPAAVCSRSSDQRQSDVGAAVCGSTMEPLLDSDDEEPQ